MIRVRFTLSIMHQHKQNKSILSLTYTRCNVEQCKTYLELYRQISVFFFSLHEHDHVQQLQTYKGKKTNPELKTSVSCGNIFPAIMKKQGPTLRPRGPIFRQGQGGRLVLSTMAI